MELYLEQFQKRFHRTRQTLVPVHDDPKLSRDPMTRNFVIPQYTGFYLRLDTAARHKGASKPLRYGSLESFRRFDFHHALARHPSRPEGFLNERSRQRSFLSKNQRRLGNLLQRYRTVFRQRVSWRSDEDKLVGQKVKNFQVRRSGQHAGDDANIQLIRQYSSFRL